MISVKKIVKIVFLLLIIISEMSFGQKADLPPPNILWISWEDVGPHFGAYGDDYAVTVVNLTTTHEGRLSETKQEKEKARQKFTGLISDSSPIVRIEAAFGLCEYGDFDRGIPVLKAAIEYEQESVRLYALNQLDKMGKKAEMAFPLLEIPEIPEIPEGTANNYSNRIIIRIYKRLGIKPLYMDNITARQRQDIQKIYDTIILNQSWNYGFKD